MAYPQFYQQYPQQIQQQSNTGLVPVPSEMVARNYPVGYGQSVSFRDENAPYLYTKTMGFSQLETPKFEKYRLVKEETEAPVEEPVKITYADKSEVERLQSEIDSLKKEVTELKEGV